MTDQLENKSSDSKLKKRLDFRVIIPNIVTLIALCAGVSSIKFAFDGQYHIAAAAILISAILDGLDGQIARALRGTSSFGAELDSLADLVNFGVAPALILYIWLLNNAQNFGWFACLMFITAMALRLARFNVGNNILIEADESNIDPQEDKPAKTFFLGIPAPASALMSLVPLYIDLSGLLSVSFISEILAAFYIIILAILTVSPIKTFSPKILRFKRSMAGPVFILMAFIAVSMVTFTWLSLIICAIIYMIHIIYATMRYFRKETKIN
ncbi:MAG: phosphatidylcholine/phosphatidylserine synthase [Pseudomonadota bacterium]